jgi:hypothetical protein
VKKVQQPGKLEQRWRGPYLIFKLGFPGTYWIQDLGQGEISSSTVSEENLALWRRKEDVGLMGEREDDIVTTELVDRSSGVYGEVGQSSRRLEVVQGRIGVQGSKGSTRRGSNLEVEGSLKGQGDGRRSPCAGISE